MSKVITSIKNLWNQFWFIEQPTYSLGAFRICIGLLILWMHILSFPNWDRFYGPNGALSFSYLMDSEFLSIFFLSDQQWYLWCIYYFTLFVTLTFTTGYKTRVSTVLLFIIYASLYHRNYYVTNGQDGVIKMFLFLLCFAPSGDSFSVDEYLRFGRFRIFDRSRESDKKTLWIVRIMQIAVVNMYIFGVPGKLANDSAWRNGMAIYYLSLSDRWFRFPHINLFHNELLSIFLTYFTLFIEAAFVFLIWFKNLRPYILIGIVFFHTSLLIFLNTSVFYFGISVLISFIVFINPESIKLLVNSQFKNHLLSTVLNKTKHFVHTTKLFIKNHYAVLGIILLGAILRTYFFVGVTGNIDDLNEYLNVMQAKYYYPSMTWPGYNRLGIIIPKYIFYSLFGLNDISSGLYPYLCSIFCIFLCYQIGLKLFNKSSGLFAAFIMALSPYDLAYSSIPVVQDICNSMWVGILVLFVIKFLETKKISFFIMGIISSLIVWKSKIMGILILAPILLLFWDNKKHYIYFILSCLSFILIEQLIASLFAGGLFPDYVSQQHDYKWLINPFKGWEDILYGLRYFHSNFAFGIHFLLIPFALSATFFLKGKNTRRNFIFLFLWALTFFFYLIIKPAGFDFSQWKLYIFSFHRTRYFHLSLIPASIILGILCSTLYQFKNKIIFYVVILTIGIFSLTKANSHHNITLNHRNWVKSVVQEIATLPRNSKIILDSALMSWIEIKEPHLKRKYNIISLANDYTFNINKIYSEKNYIPNKTFIVAGGPRGINNIDQWRITRWNVPPNIPVEIVWEKSPGGIIFDKNFHAIDSTQILKITQ